MREVIADPNPAEGRCRAGRGMGLGVMSRIAKGKSFMNYEEEIHNVLINN